MTPRRIALAGSTGSIGTQALEVCRAERERFEIVAIGALASVDLLASQAQEFRPRLVALADSSRAQELKELLPADTELRCGPGALASLGAESDVDTVLNGVVGFAGLDVTVQALAYSKRLALANKESLIAGAPVVRRARESGSGEILPVDSEHCAIHQCIGRRAGPEGAAEVRRIILTASGGPFRGKRLAELRSVAVADALSHPTWKMGPKITVDSSTLMNKGLEVLEAKELFGLSIEQIEIVVHPQSIVHSMVEFCDGATIAQLSWPDMRLPIGYCLAYPDRLQTAYGALDWSRTAKLEFEEPDAETFACLRLAYDAGREGGAAPAWLNAANEVAVAAFLEGRIGWLDIASVVKETMERFAQCELCTAEDVLEADGRARACAALVVERSYAA